MCYLITFAVPQADASAVPNGRLPRVDAHENESVTALFGRGFALFSMTDGGCSCNLYSSGSTQNRSAKRQRSLRQKYERLGWSTEKIERALNSSSDALHQRAGSSGGGLRQDVAAFFADLARRTEQVKLIVNEFRGSFVDESVSASGRTDLSASELVEHPEQIEANIVYTVRRSA